VPSYGIGEIVMQGSGVMLGDKLGSGVGHGDGVTVVGGGVVMLGEGLGVIASTSAWRTTWVSEFTTA
jgi:hypothetical protein